MRRIICWARAHKLQAIFLALFAAPFIHYGSTKPPHPPQPPDPPQPPTPVVTELPLAFRRLEALAGQTNKLIRASRDYWR